MSESRVGARQRDRRARLDRAAGDPVVVKLQLDRVRGPRERALDRRCVAALPAKAHVPGRLGVQLRRTVRERIEPPRSPRAAARSRRRRARRRRARRRGLRQDDRHRLADVPHAPARERPPRRLGHRLAAFERIAQSERIGPTPSAAMSAPVSTATTPAADAAATRRSSGCGRARAASAR